jgi:flagellum-specific ATP synthase
LNHYPAIDVLQSVSRLTRDLLTPAQLDVAGRARESMAVYKKNQDLITIGAYAAGSQPAIDQAIRLHAPLNTFLRQSVSETQTVAASWETLTRLMTPPAPPAQPPQRNR